MAISQITREGDVSPFVSTGGIPNGAKFHKDGRLFVAHRERGILDISPDGKIRVAASEWDGQRFAGPNDLIFTRRGDMYFTDPEGSGVDDPIGNVFILRRDGKVEHFAGGLVYPNGIVLSDDERTLYVAETYSRRIWAFELDAQGHEQTRRLFVQLEGWAGPDGMAFGQDGNLYVAHIGKGVVDVVTPQGKVIAELPAGAKHPTNVAFWDTSLYVTDAEKGQVTRLDIGIAGQLLYGLA